MNTSNLHPTVTKLLNQRGFSSPEEINNFFSWNLRDIPELTDMIDMDKTSDRIIKALDNNETIGIYGDYDVDGTTSCALFYHYFKMLGVETKLFQPSRFVEGYGVHPVSVDNALEEGVDLLITVDCGITNLETADYANEKGLDLIITDHHKDAREHLPKAFSVVNPNRRDEEKSKLKTLAGVGVAFAVCLDIKKKLDKRGEDTPSIYPLLQFVSIGTICDLAKLDLTNIKLTRHGLKQIKETDYFGVRAFFNDEDRLFEVMPSEKISFYVGPLINSKGRLDHPDKALKLLIADNHKDAFENYSQLEISNRERKIIQGQVFKEAKEQVIKEIKTDELLSAIVYNSEWHEGVIGIVASKIVESFEIPAVIFTNAEEKGIIKASARSAGDLNLYELLKSCSDLFIKFGGHKAAAGLSMKQENFNAFKERMNSLLSEIPEIQRTVQHKYDLNLNFNEINRQLVKELEIMEPFGMGNSKPIFKMSDAKIFTFTILKDVHVKWVFVDAKNPKNKIQGISFNFIGKWNTMLPQELTNIQDSQGLDIFFTLGVNRFRGNETIQLMVEKVVPSGQA